MVITKNGMKAPEEFFYLIHDQHKNICNGCGPKGWGWIVPDKFRLIGVDFTPACNIHDYCYYTRMPKKDADNLFLENMLTISSKSWLSFLAQRFAFLYYLAVKNGGAGAYNRSGVKK